MRKKIAGSKQPRLQKHAVEIIFFDEVMLWNYWQARQRIGQRALTAGAGLSALAVCMLLAVGTLDSRKTIVLEQSSGDPLPSVSSACIYGNEECVIAIKGGSLKLSDFKFPEGDGKPGKATASGYINGQFVSGEVDLGMAKPTRDAFWTGKEGKRPQNSASIYNGPVKLNSNKQTTLHQTKAGKLHKTVKLESEEPASEAKEGAEGAEGDSKEDEHEKEYKLALKAVESRIFAREKKVEAEAKKIAEAVTRVITSPAVTERVASIAMKAAAIKQKEQSVGGASGHGSAGSDQFGFEAQPAGAKQAAGAPSTTLATMPASTLFIHGVSTL
jgi:hypothetical protein